MSVPRATRTRGAATIMVPMSEQQLVAVLNAVTDAVRTADLDNRCTLARARDRMATIVAALHQDR